MSNGPKGWRVRCQTCGCTDLYETSEYYNPNIPLTGDMLELQEPYKAWGWPVYDGSLAVKSTSRFLIFCAQCSGYVSTTGKITFTDFPEGPHVVSEERSRMGYDGEIEPLPEVAPLPFLEELEAVDNLILSFAEDSMLSDDLQKAETPTIDPEALIRKIEKEGSISINDREAKAKNLDDLDTPQGLFKKMGRGK